MGKLTTIGRGQRGIDFFRGRTSIWVGLGRTTPWPDEDNPPSESVSASAVDELFGLRLFEEASLVIESETGSITHEGKTYARVDESQLDEFPTNLLYVKFVVEPDQFPGIDYRQYGVFVDAIPGQGFSDYSALTPGQFQSLGRLVYLDNFTKVTRYTNTRHEIVVIIPG
jgi:hypothetical protein